MNIVECALVRYYAGKVIDRCDLLLEDKADEQTLEDSDDPPGSLTA
jgi:hypothetical protein